METIRLLARHPASVGGIALTLALAFVARFGSSEIASFLMKGKASPISPVLLGIVLGMLWRHFVGLSAGAQQGVQWILGTILHIGIALVGLRLTLSGLADIGPSALAVIAACVTAALLTSWILGRMLGLSSGVQKLLAVGSAVCGCTAIVATSAAIRARPAETGIALTCVVLVGSLGMLLYPWLAATLLHEQSQLAGIFLGSAIHDTSQVIGASLIYAQQFASPEVVGFASATKLFRNLSIVLLVPLLAWGARGYQSDSDQPAEDRKPLVPWFIVGFVILVMIRTLGDQTIASHAQAGPAWQWMLGASQAVSDLFMICGMTAVGLSVSLTQMNQAGFRPICAALIIAAVTATCSLGVIRGLLA